MLEVLVLFVPFWGDYIFLLPNVVSMNQTGVSVEGDVMDDALLEADFSGYEFE